MWLKYIKNQDGNAVILTVLIMTIIIGFVGLVTDSGLVIYNRQKMQHAVDLSALAAVQETITNHGQVVSTAIEFLKKNGINDNSGDIFVITHPYQGDNHRLEVSASRTINLFFLPVIGIDTSDISVKAAAKATFHSETMVSEKALEYAVFSGSNGVDLQIKGNGSVIKGNVHGNKKVAIQGANHTINGNLSSVDGISGDVSRVSGTIINKGPIVPMPNLAFDEYAAKADKISNGDVSLGNVDINGIHLINGNCTINGSKIAGRGILLVTGEVKLAGNNLTYATPNDLLAIYSHTNIRISGNGINIHGVLYAPYGQILINGFNNRFWGALIANEIVWATKDITINGNYDIRVPQAFTETTTSYNLFE